MKVISIGLLLFLVSYFLPISNKASNNIFYGFVLLPFIISLFTKQRRIYSTGKLFPYFLALLAMMSLATLSHDYEKAIKYFIYLLAFWVVVSTLVRENIIDSDKLAIFMMALSLLLSVTLLLLHVFVYDQPIRVRPNYWHTWILGSPIMISMALTFFTSTGLTVLVKRGHYILSVLILSFSIILQTLFQTRSGLAGYLGVSGFLILFGLVSGIDSKTYKNNKKKIITVLVGSLLLIMASYLFGFFDTLIARGSSYRLELYSTTLDEFLSNCNLLLGCGISYEFVATLSGGVPINHPHSIYSSQLLYFGSISLILLLLLQFRTIILNFTSTNPWFIGFIASSTFFLVDGSKLLTHPDIEWLFLWLPLAILDGYSYKKH